MAWIGAGVKVAEGRRGAREGASGVRRDFPGPRGEEYFLFPRCCCRPPITVCPRSYCSLLCRCCQFRWFYRS